MHHFSSTCGHQYQCHPCPFCPCFSLEVSVHRRPEGDGLVVVLKSGLVYGLPLTLGPKCSPMRKFWFQFRKHRFTLSDISCSNLTHNQADSNFCSFLVSGKLVLHTWRTLRFGWFFFLWNFHYFQKAVYMPALSDWLLMLSNEVVPLDGGRPITLAGSAHQRVAFKMWKCCPGHIILIWLDICNIVLSLMLALT
jgi:hypothetical protein